MHSDPGEKLRSGALLSHLNIVPDSEFSGITATLADSLFGPRRNNSTIRSVFGVAQQWHAVTLTGNISILRAAQHHRIELNAIRHRPTALTGGHLARMLTIQRAMEEANS